MNAFTAAKSFRKEDGTIDHVARLREDSYHSIPVEDKPLTHRAYYDRVVVIGNNADVKLIQSRLPKEFQEFEPVDINDLLTNDWRPEPHRIIFATDVFAFHDKKAILGHYLCYSYAFIVNDTVDGEWVDLRDATSIRWGRLVNEDYSHPDTIRSHDVLNGRRTLENL